MSRNMTPYRTRNVCLRERQLLPIDVWLRLRFKDTAITASDFITTTPQNDGRGTLASFLISHVPWLVHILPPANQLGIPELAHVSLLSSSSSPSSSVKEAVDRIMNDIFATRTATPTTTDSTKCDSVSTSTALHRWYASKVPRRDSHLRQNLVQEVALLEAAAWTCNQQSSGANHRKWRPKTIVDAGGGNGVLALLAQERLCCDQVVVIDSDHPPLSIDGVYEGEENLISKHSNPYFRRIRKGLDEVDWRSDLGVATGDDVLVISKHLCGGAVDTLLRSLNQQLFFPRALCLSSCCHFKRQNRANYIFPSFLDDVLRLHGDSPWIEDIVAAGCCDLLTPYSTLPTPPRAHGDDDDCPPSLRQVQDFLLPLTTELKKKRGFVAAREQQTRHVAARERDAQRKAKWRIAHTLALIEQQGLKQQAQPQDDAQSESPSVPSRSRHRDPSRSLLAAVAARTNWIGTHEEQWMQSLGKDIEFLLDSGRVAFLRQRMNYTAAQMVPFVPLEVTPRNQLLAAWRRGEVSSGALLLT